MGQDTGMPHQNRSRLIKIFILIVIPACVYLLPAFFMPLMEPDEARYSLIPDEMNASGDYITPRLKGVLYFEKPPLSYWATAISFRIFGRNAFAARLFSALAAWGCIFLAYRMGLFFSDAQGGLYAAAVLATFAFHAAIGRINTLDMPLAFFVGIAIWSGFRFFAGAKTQRLWLYLLYGAGALAFLTKGLIGVVFPFGVVGIWLLVSRRFRDILYLFSPIGILAFAAISFPWLILVQKQHPDFFHFFFVQEHILRYTTQIHQRYEPFYYYIPVLFVGAMPWIAYLPEARKGMSWRSGFMGRDGGLFLLSWIGVIFLFFSFSSSKLIPYIAPVFPPLAVLFGMIFRQGQTAGTDSSQAWGGYRLFGVLQAALFIVALFIPIFLKKHGISWQAWLPVIAVPLLIQILLIVLPYQKKDATFPERFYAIYLLFALFLAFLTWPLTHFLSPYKSAYQVALAIEEKVPKTAELYQFGISLYGIDFYTGRRTAIVDDIGELTYGAKQLPVEEREKYFLYSNSFLDMVKGDNAIYCVTKNDGKIAILKKEASRMRLLWRNDAFSLLELNGG
jgi:4-amino-4-deoxy-L-arabinose transferase-like glycosyltransferase